MTGFVKNKTGFALHMTDFVIKMTNYDLSIQRVNNARVSTVYFSLQPFVYWEVGRGKR